MQELETLTVKDMMQIFQLSQVSVYRRLREAKAGRGGLPLPIPTGAKRSLRWNLGTVQEFLENTNGTRPMSSLPIESAAQRAARNRVALRNLEKFGIKIPPNGAK